MKVALNALAALLACALLASGCGRADVSESEPGPRPTPPPERVRIGAVLALTGATSQYGLSAYNGMSMAVEEANAEGGVGGGRVELIVQDTRSDLEETRRVVRRLVEDYNVAALLGEVTSARTLAAAEVAQELGVALLTPSATNPEVTRRGDFVFRGCYTDPFQGAALAQFAARDLGASRAAVISERGQEYSAGLARYIREEFERQGGEVVFEGEYEPGADDFAGLLARAAEARPEVVFVPGYYLEAGLLAREAGRAELGAPLVGGDGWDSPRLAELGGEALAGNYLSSHFAAEDESPRVARFVGEYRRLYGSAPDSFAATAYDAARLLLDAVARAGNLDRRAVRDHLAATRAFPGVTGDVTFDQNGDALKPLVLIRLGPHGAREVVRHIAPSDLLPEPTPTPSPTPQRRRRHRAR
ncbi:MAG TPA: ABC transporter substrate-binding protein [Pyrinomonadaceae bacterium]|nr:ABC transporter substrate-binding protein [Pyrinomonadaceae bacterium]